MLGTACSTLGCTIKWDMWGAAVVQLRVYWVLLWCTVMEAWCNGTIGACWVLLLCRGANHARVLDVVGLLGATLAHCARVWHSVGCLM